MKKFEVNYLPPICNVIATIVYVLWFISLFVIASICVDLSTSRNENDMKLIATFLPVAILMIIILVFKCFESIPTTVEYGAEKVNWKWLKIEYTVNFSDVKSVNYKIIHQRTRYGYNHRFEIVFNLKNGTKLKLSDRLELEDIDNGINGITDDIKLMQLYRFIEKFYPQKASGFVKSGYTY
ncbi:MAG: hypothetical protein K2L10_10960 [Ruminococcus sp.]|nr:hypothetical protein [Ruminococcus sp.]